jgi:molybdopterin adenylyltransferase
MSPLDPHQHPPAVSLGCAVVTLSDTRTGQADRSGRAIARMLEDAGHRVVAYQVIPDDPDRLDALLAELENRDDVRVILTNGGTGISRRDQTVPVIQRHLTTMLPGFGELFRMLSFEQVGARAMLSRALGGLAGGKILFALPGSTPAVELAMSRLILPQLPHLAAELCR